MQLHQYQSGFSWVVVGKIPKDPTSMSAEEPMQALKGRVGPKGERIPQEEHTRHSAVSTILPKLSPEIIHTVGPMDKIR